MKVSEKMKTIKEIADELGVSKQAIRNRIEKLSLQNEVHIVGNRMLIDEEIENCIKLDILRNEQEKSKFYTQEFAKSAKIAKNVTNEFAKNTKFANAKIEKSTNFEHDISAKNENIGAKNANNAPKIANNENNDNNEKNGNIEFFEKIINTLQEQLEIKDKQIAELTSVLRHQAQSINAREQNMLAESIETKAIRKEMKEKKGFWARLFGRD